MKKIVHFVGPYCICISKCTVRKSVKYSSTLSLTSSLGGLDCHRHAPAVLLPWEIRYPFHRPFGWPQSRSGRVRKISPHPGFDPRNVQIASHYTDCPRKGIWLSCFAAGRVWHRAVGAIIRFVILWFILLVTTNRLAFALWVGLLWQAGAYLLSSSYYDIVLCEYFISLNEFD